MDSKNKVARLLTFEEAFLGIFSVLAILFFQPIIFFSWKKMHALDMYFLSLVFIAAGLTFTSISRRIFYRPKIGRVTVICFLIFIVTMIISLLRVDQNGLWVDENYHIFFLGRHSIVDAGFRQVNPPLLGLFIKPFWELVANYPWVSRLPSLVAGSALGVVFFLYAIRLKLPLVPAFLLTLLLLLHPIVEIFRTEARPVSLGIVLLLVFMGMVRRLEISNFSLIVLFTVFSSFLFSLLTLGLQPIALGFGVGLYSLIMSLKDRRFLSLGVCLLLAVVFFLPFQFSIFENTPVNTAALFSGDITLLLGAFRIDTFRSAFNYFLFPYVFLFLPLLSLGKRRMLLLFNFLRKKREALMIFFCLISLMFVFLPMFHGYANGPFRSYYLLIIFPVFLLLIASVWSVLLRISTNRMRNIFYFYFFLFCSSVLAFNLNEPKEFSDDYSRLDFRQVGQWIANDANSDGSFYLAEVCAFGSERWCPDEPYYVDTYIDPYLEAQRRLDSMYPKENVLRFYNQTFSKPIRVKNVYFVFHSMRGNRQKALLEFIKQTFPNVPHQVFNGFLTMKFATKSEDARKEIVKWMSAFLSHCKNIESDCFWIHSTLASAAFGMGKEKDARFHYETFLGNKEIRVRNARKADYRIDFESLNNLIQKQVGGKE